MNSVGNEYEVRRTHLEELVRGTEEYCTHCFKRLGFAKSLHIHSPQRYIGGAFYVEGSGQVCGECVREIYGSNSQ